MIRGLACLLAFVSFLAGSACSNGNRAGRSEPTGREEEAEGPSIGLGLEFAIGENSDSPDYTFASIQTILPTPDGTTWMVDPPPKGQRKYAGVDHTSDVEPSGSKRVMRFGIP